MTGRLIIVPLLLLTSAFGQFNAGSPVMMGHVRVSVSFTNHSECLPTTRVALDANSGVTLGEASVNSQCAATFFDVPPGNYSVRVVGADVADAGRTEFALSAGMTQEVDVRARRFGDSDTSQATAGSAFVSLNELGVPRNAQREFEKASQLISRQEWPKALEKLQKAIVLYPRFAAAYNNLGAVYIHTGERTKAREALESAIALNDHLAAAYLNLARLSFRAKEFPEVETDVQKVLALAPASTEELTLLAVAQLADRHFDGAIQTSDQAHRSQLSHHAFLHLVAARAEDLEGKADDSVSAELQQYLNEEPNGSRVDEVKKSLAILGSRPATH